MSQEPVRYWVPRSTLVEVGSFLRDHTNEEVVSASAYDTVVRELEEANVERDNWRQIVKNMCEVDEQCRVLLSVYDTSDSHGVLPIDALIEKALAALQEQVKGLEESVKVGLDISGSFFAALKPLNLTSINLLDPGTHVTTLVQQLATLTAENAKLREELAKRKRVNEDAMMDLP